jgi:predicted kinase
MLEIILCCGAPASGKSSWAREQVAKDPENWVRINNDDLRAMCNGSVWSANYEKLITNTRNFLIREALKMDKNVILDNVNANKRHFEDACKIAATMQKDIKVRQQLFYCEIEELLERDAKRTGTAQVGEAVVRKWFKELGGKQFKFANPKIEIFVAGQAPTNADGGIRPPPFKDGKEKVLVCDLDGTISLFCCTDKKGNKVIRHPDAPWRNPYDAAKADNDLPNEAVVEAIKMAHAYGLKIVFCSGRYKDYEPQTRIFLDNAIPGIPYELLMRNSGDSRKDAIIKEELYTTHIEPNYNVVFVLDDRKQVVDFWRSKGLACFQVAEGDF